MGNRYSSLSIDDLEELGKTTPFNTKQLESLYKRFEHLDKDKSGTLNAEKLLSVPELAMNPLIPRLLEVLGVDNGGELGFIGFVKFLSIFHPSALKEDKLKLIFTLFNLNNDGLLKHSELSDMLRMMVGTFHGGEGAQEDEEELDLLVKETFRDADQNNDGFIDNEEFLLAMNRTEVLNNMTFDFC